MNVAVTIGGSLVGVGALAALLANKREKRPVLVPAEA
jgi:hypothetical protein